MHTLPSIKKVIWVVIGSMALLAVIAGTLFGAVDADRRWHETYAQKILHFDAAVADHRGALIQGQHQDFLVDLQAAMKNLGIHAVYVHNFVTQDRFTVHSPYGQQANDLAPSDCVASIDQSLWNALWHHCNRMRYLAYFDMQKKHPFLHLDWRANTPTLHLLLRRTGTYVVIFLIFATILGAIVSVRVRRSYVEPVISLARKFRTGSLDTLRALSDESIQPTYAEISALYDGTRELARKILEYQANLIEHTTASTAEKVARQVAHDIRSPLTALKVVSAHLSEVSEEKRVMIRNAVHRIEDIANDLAERKQQSTSTTTDGAKEPTSVQLLSSLIEPLISEKRTQHRGRFGVQIHSSLDAQSYGLFAIVQPIEFKRVLSNLVNNAVEALEGSGDVTVAMAQNASLVVIRVTDTGQGIPPEILPKLMQRGATFGKATGSGLGLFHARTTVELWDGTMELASAVGTGTTVTIMLPRAEAPAWFVPEVQLTAGSAIVIVDDDASIHQVWEERFAALDMVSQCITTQHFSAGTDVTGWYTSDPSTLFLCDYEFLGEPCNGLDLIEQLAIQEQSILVTSRYEEADVQQRCAAMGVRLIPKGLAGFVPIQIRRSSSDGRHVADPSDAPHSQADTMCVPKNDGIKPKVLVLDDDAGIRMAWELEQERLGVGELQAYASMEACEIASPEYARYDFAFVDKNIPESAWRIDQVIQHLKNRGVKRVLIATGETAQNVREDPLCTGADGIVRGKIPETLHSEQNMVPISRKPPTI